MFAFVPQQDITVYELAASLPLLMNAAACTPQQQSAIISAFPPEVARHWAIRAPQA